MDIMFKKLYEKVFGKKVKLDSIVNSIDLTSDKLHIIQLDTGMMPKSKADEYIKACADAIRDVSKVDSETFKFVVIGKSKRY